jgi:hypothetical protein
MHLQPSVPLLVSVRRFLPNHNNTNHIDNNTTNNDNNDNNNNVNNNHSAYHNANGPGYQR